MTDRAKVAAAIHAHLCVCPKHGYTQGGGRWGTSYNPCEVVIEGRSYYVNGGDRDCSSSVSDAWRKALEPTSYKGILGVDANTGATWTGNEKQAFLASGLFDWHPMGDGYIAQTGDVYLRHNWYNSTGHTAMCQSATPDLLSEFVHNEFGTSMGGQVGDQTGGESRICGYYNFPWDGILAYNHKADSKPLPDALKGYIDLDPNAWYIPYIEKVVKAGIMSGTDSKHFKPNDVCTRAQCIVTLARKLGWKTDDVLPFKDIASWYTAAIVEAFNRGVASKAEYFRPDSAAKREDFATFMWRAKGKPDAKPCEEASDYAKTAMGWAIERGIITGKPRPKEALTRAEAAAMLSRL